MKKIILGAFSASTLAFAATTPVQAIGFVWNGTATYQCANNGNTCSITATNFTLGYDIATGKWSNVAAGNGSIVLTNLNSTQTRTISNLQLAFTPEAPDPLGGINYGQAFTLSQDSGNAFYATFYLSSTPTGVANEAVSIAAVGAPSYTTFGNLPSGADPNPAVLSSAILGLSAPGPLGLLALLPIANLITKSRSRHSKSTV